jgi:hypothetical protein
MEYGQWDDKPGQPAELAGPGGWCGRPPGAQGRMVPGADHEVDLQIPGEGK